MHTPRILIVDDDEPTRRLFSRILSEVGYFITVVDTGHRALMQIRARSYQAMVVDLSLPDMEGIKLIRQARQDASQVKILVVAGFMAGSMLALASELGANATLNKLRAPERLFPVVCKMLDDWSDPGPNSSI